MDPVPSWAPTCPVPIDEQSERILLAHGEGARLSRRLIAERILPRFASPGATHFQDAATVTTVGCRLAICTDSHTVSPMFFPGGDLGSLAVFGTVNDLAVAGSHPRWLTLSLIIEEGLPISVLERILDSVSEAARQCRVRIVAGDTKVVPRGAADGLYLNTSGVGELIDPVPPGPCAIREGDQILVSGPVGQHGIAVLSVREGYFFDSAPLSDSGSVIEQVVALRDSIGPHIRAMRDATRGGVSAVLHEWATECQQSFVLSESAVPQTESVRGACELLGLDPLYVASEGMIVVAVDRDYASEAVCALRSVKGCEQAAVIGEVTARGICPVSIRRVLGTPQPLDEPSGAPLPRIC